MSLLLFNVGVPILFPSMGLMLIALVPVIVLESCYISNFLSINFWNTLRNVGLANVFSTLIGIPATWLLLVILTYLTGGGRYYQVNCSLKRLLILICESAWVAPYGRNLRWMIPAANLVLLIPFFFASWFSESWIIDYFWGNIDKTEVNNALRNANLLSYAMPAFYLLIKLIREKHKISGIMSYRYLETRRAIRL